MKKTLIGFLVLCTLWTSSSTIKAEEAPEKTPEVSAKSGSAVLMDADNKSVLFNHNATTKMYPASITKIMTVLLALEKLPLDQEITVNQTALDAVEAGSSHIALSADEVILVEDLCYATILASANDGANVLGEAVSGSMEEFAKLMTARAKELGALSTNFTNPSGLPDDNHYTTAYDMALITAAAIKNETFLKMFSTISYTARPTNKQAEPRIFANGNNLIKKGAENYEYAIGGKTGWTTPAEYTLVTYAEKDDLKLIVVTMKGVDRKTTYEDTVNLFDYAFNQFHKVIVKKDLIETKSGEIYEGNYLHAKYTTSIEHDFGLLVPLSVTQENIRYEVVIENENDVDLIEAKLKIYLQDTYVGELPMILEKEIFDVSFKNTTLKEIISYFNFFCIGVLSLSLLVLLSKLMKQFMKPR